VLKLQPLLEQCYRRGRYHTIDYSEPITSGFNATDLQWMSQMLANQNG